MTTTTTRTEILLPLDYAGQLAIGWTNAAPIDSLVGYVKGYIGKGSVSYRTYGSNDVTFVITVANGNGGGYMWALSNVLTDSGITHTVQESEFFGSYRILLSLSR